MSSPSDASAQPGSDAIKLAFVFPGQGPQEPSMLDLAKDAGALYAVLSDVAGTDIRARVTAEGAAFLRRNEIASAVTVFCSAIELSRLRDRGISPAMCAGYSVGQWTAMFAAGMLSYEAALRTVWRRAELMNQSDAVKDGAMLAVIGLATDQVDTVCREIDASGDFVAISNYNCLGQLSLAGTTRGIARAEEKLQSMSPRKVARVEVAGAWHSKLLESAARAFEDHLARVELRAPSVPVMDNVTGEALPSDPSALRKTLARHLAAPVQWERSVRTMIAGGAESFVEVGYGDMLSKFGFFIDRKKKHQPSSKIT
jgi:[acyl-carrier-protein] S-malonyltransferase